MSKAISVKGHTTLPVLGFGVTTAVTSLAMRPPLRLEANRKSGAIRYILFRQSPNPLSFTHSHRHMLVIFFGYADT
jgi:hypothetical protein